MSQVLIVAFLALQMFVAPQEKPSDQQHHGVEHRGDAVMGFLHEKTDHHFFLYSDGGAIVADAKDPKDADSRDAIRMHFRHIAQMFAEGNFKAPMLIHEQEPPGVATMKQLREEIRYQFEPSERGGRVRITTSNAKALAAIHDFLRFQIKDHHTGDSP